MPGPCRKRSHHGNSASLGFEANHWVTGDMPRGNIQPGDFKHAAPWLTSFGTRRSLDGD
jgi:hypothetical protein